MSRTADPKTLTEAYVALADGSLSVGQRSGLRTLARFLKTTGVAVPTVAPTTVKASTAPKAKGLATGPRKTNDPEAPYGRKADGTPRNKPGRKAAVVAPVVEAKPKRTRKAAAPVAA